MKKNCRLWWVVFLLLPLAYFFRCSTLQDSIGEEDEIIVFADSLDWLQYKDALNSVFGKEFRTPVLEREFILKWAPYRYFDLYKKEKNIFFLGRLDSQEPVSKNVRELLNPEIIEGVRSGQYFYIPKHNVWALNQYVLFLVSNSTDDMIQKTHDLGDLMYRDFRKFYYTRLSKRMFERMEQTKLEKYIESHFPFRMRVQHDYFIATESLEDGFVWIRRMHPDRSIFVHWLSKPEGFQLTSRWVIDERNRLTQKYYSGDLVVEDETRAFSTKFKDWRAIRLEGTWRNDQVMVGGPFRSYTFTDSATNRIYMIDYYVQAVGQRKKPFLDQLYVIAHSFRPMKSPRGEK